MVVLLRTIEASRYEHVHLVSILLYPDAVSKDQAPTGSKLLIFAKSAGGRGDILRKNPDPDQASRFSPYDTFGGEGVSHECFYSGYLFQSSYNWTLFLFYLQCPCPSCKVLNQPETGYVVQVGDSTYSLTDGVFPCHVNTYVLGPEVLRYKMSTWMVLNLMFWPTLFFMVGFVGLFFSCLYLQYEDCSNNWCSRTLRI